MSDIRIDETCSCGATFTVTGSNYRSAAGGGAAANGTCRSAEEMAERWRTDHRHEMPRQPRVQIKGGSR